MNLSLTFTRIFFFILSIFFMTLYMLSIPSESKLLHGLLGVAIGSGFGFLLIGFDLLFKRYNLRSFNIAIVGLFVGYLMGLALDLIFRTILDLSSITSLLSSQLIEIIKISLFLFGTYLGTLMTLRASDEFYVSIPFVKFTLMSQKKKDLLVDISALADSRVIDLAASGILNDHLIIPNFIIKEIYAQIEGVEENLKAKAKKCLETLKKLEEISELSLRYNDTDFPEIKDISGKLIRLSRLLDTNLLSSDVSRVQKDSIEGIRIINLHALSNALKPLMQAGERIKIKIQRYGKEPRQGVGYLEDGTMVVVNGGGDFIGEIIDALVLSVKHTASGRMIFCNTTENESIGPTNTGYDQNEDSY